MRAQEIFVGPIGLRSGWRLLIFLAIVIAFEAAFQEVVVLILKARGIVEPEGLYAMVFLVGDAITLIAVVIATWIMARWEHRKLSSYGLPGKNAFGRRFWEGAVFGYAGVSALILLIFLAGGYSAGSLALHGAAFRRASLFQQAVRALARLGFDRSTRVTYLPDASPHRRFAIRHRVPRRIRFRGYLCLLRAERRAAGPGPLADRHVPRRGLAYRRKARARGQLVRVSGDRRDVPRVSRSVPRPVGNLWAIFTGA